jgi:signal transduction histidine kinase
MWQVGRPGFFWRGVLIVLPVFILAGIGFYYGLQERTLAEAEARRLGQSLAEECARAISTELTRLIADPEILPASPLTVDAAGNLVTVSGSPSRAAIPGGGAPHPLLTLKLSPAQKLMWENAREAEFSGRTDAAAELQKFIDSKPPQEFVTQAKYNLALIYSRNGKAAAANDLFVEVARDQQAQTEAGLPLTVLARYQSWQLTGKDAEDLCSSAIEHPSLITPSILAAASSGVDRWNRVWARDEAARELYQRLKKSPRAVKTGASWMPWKDREILVVAAPIENVPNQFSIFSLPVDLVRKTVVNCLVSGPQASVPYAWAEVELAGRPMRPGNNLQPYLGSAESFFPAGFGALITVTERLAVPELVYAQALRRTRWIVVLILCAAAAALVGLVSAYRGYCQQRWLSEMKSNFVSSVSHELRAPIASMRLIAEGLDRGTVSGEAKQKEYFGFLVQESRRLASLIENILDFSRIEQGRKRYELAPTDLGALADQTLRLMRPAAAQKQIGLELQNDCGKSANSVNCDGLAIQQALINLIDNAVKHSRGGETVIVGLEGNGAGLRLSVTDRGPGIPLEEQEKIFERFYRRGSELRRETQGIGIGLTIVKHIVEGHGGRVTVRSAVGEGSCFTIELPGSGTSHE